MSVVAALLLPPTSCRADAVKELTGLSSCLISAAHVQHSTASFEATYRRAVERSAYWHRGQFWVDQLPYAEHYRQVEGVLKELGWTADKGQRVRDVILAARLHDVEEDTDTTIAEIRAEFGPNVAEIVDAVSHVMVDDPAHPGKKKKDEAATLAKIRKHPDAIILKLADRIANMRSYQNTGRSPDHYVASYRQFRDDLHRPGELDAMWAELDRLTYENDTLVRRKEP